jgi:hypothetical protein
MNNQKAGKREIGGKSHKSFNKCACIYIYGPLVQYHTFLDQIVLINYFSVFY